MILGSSLNFCRSIATPSSKDMASRSVTGVSGALFAFTDHMIMHAFPWSLTEVLRWSYIPNIVVHGASPYEQEASRVSHSVYCCRLVPERAILCSSSGFCRPAAPGDGRYDRSCSAHRGDHGEPPACGCFKQRSQN